MRTTPITNRTMYTSITLLLIALTFIFSGKFNWGVGAMVMAYLILIIGAFAEGW